MRTVLAGQVRRSRLLPLLFWLLLDDCGVEEAASSSPAGPTRCAKHLKLTVAQLQSRGVRAW